MKRNNKCFDLGIVTGLIAMMWYGDRHCRHRVMMTKETTTAPSPMKLNKLKKYSCQNHVINFFRQKLKFHFFFTRN